MQHVFNIALFILSLCLSTRAYAQPVDGCYYPKNNTHPDNYAVAPPTTEVKVVAALAGDSNSTNANYLWIRGAALGKFSYPTGVHPLNLALSGAVAAQTHPVPNIPKEWTGFYQVESALSFQPQILIIALGTNDLIFGRTPLQAFTDIKLLVDGAEAVALQLDFPLIVKVLKVPDITEAITFVDYAILQAKIQALNDLLLAEYEPTKQFIDPEHEIDSEYLEDGLHINALGQTKRADTYTKVFAPPGTDLFDPDTDDDGITDYLEHYLLMLDPLDADSDDDGLSDQEEITLGTSPSDPDSDNDGIQDGTELGRTVEKAIPGGESSCNKTKFLGTNLTHFIPDACPEQTSDPLSQLSAGNKLADGVLDKDGDGCIDATPTPSPTVEPTTSPSSTPTSNPTSSPSPSLTPTPSVSPKPSSSSTPEPSPSTTPKASPSPPGCEILSLSSTVSSIQSAAQELIRVSRNAIKAKGRHGQCKMTAKNRVKAKQRVENLRSATQQLSTLQTECHLSAMSNCESTSTLSEKSRIEKAVRRLKKFAMQSLRSCQSSKKVTIKFQKKLVSAVSSIKEALDSYPSTLLLCSDK